MDNVKDNIAKNIAQLRKEKKWTQADLANKLNYTDKAISKWERGESTPDVDVIYEMSKIFEVTVDYFFHSDSMENKKEYKIPKGRLLKKVLQLLLLITAVWFIAIIIFVYGHIKDMNTNGLWIAFIWPLPISFLILSLFCYKNKLMTGLFCFTTAFIWTMLAAIYLQGIIFDENFWLLFIIGVPLQLALIIGVWLKK